MKDIKRFNIFIISCIAVTLMASCQSDPTQKQPKKEEYFPLDPDIPKPVGFVNDFENIYTADEEIILDSMIKDYNKRADIQIALVTFDSGMVKKDSFRAYSLKVAQQWGVGERGKNNGVLIGICKDHREICIQNGFGTARILSDAETKSIVDAAFLPEFRKNNVYDGTRQLLTSLAVVITKNKYLTK